MGSIALEEAFSLPDWAEMAAYQASFFVADGDGKAHGRRLADITDTRLKKMDEHNVDYTVLSLTAPGIQDFFDPKEAKEKAKLSNDWVAQQIKNHPKRFGAFAALSMHTPQDAAEELERCVKQHGFLGALVNDNQRSGHDGETPIFYDRPEWDHFWAKCVELDVPFYLHPIAPKGVLFEKLWKDRSYLVGPVLSFANGVSAHVLGMMVNGVFDRFPKLKLIIGHMGEHIPFDFWRINHWFEDVHKARGLKMKKTIYDYFQENISITTSGHFSTHTLLYNVAELGSDRVLFSIDYPYESFESACNWWKSTKSQLNKTDYNKISRGNAIKLMKLEKILGASQ